MVNSGTQVFLVTQERTMSVSRRTLLATLVAAPLAAALPLASAPAQARTAAQTVDVRGLGGVAVDSFNVRVLSVDLPTRTVQVERRGRQWRVTLPEEFGSLNALRRRDRLQINRVESALVSVDPAQRGARPDVAFSTARNDGMFGNLPARWVVRNVTVTARFTSFDAARGTVSYEGPEGARTVRVTDPAVVTALQRLKKGDMVRLSFTEATEFVLTPRN